MSVAGGFTSVFTAGEVSIEHPIECCVIMLFVITISSILEYLLDVAREVESQFFRIMFEAASDEVTVVSIMSMTLSFCESLFTFLPDYMVPLFSYAQICLFFMAMSLIILVAILLCALHVQGGTWKAFETKNLSRAGDRTFSPNPRSTKIFHGKELQYFKAHANFFDSLTIAGYRPDQKEKITFDEYLRKAQRPCLVHLTDLTWHSWIALISLIIVNGVRSLIVIEGKERNGLLTMTHTERLVNFASFVGICGYVPMFVFYGICRRLNQRLDLYLSEEIGNAETLAELRQPESFLFWHSRESTVTLLQMFIMFNEWYLAVFCLSMLNDCVTKFDASYRVLALAAFVPIFVFLYMLPWTVTIIVMLTHLGSNLDRDIVSKILQSANQTIKSRDRAAVDFEEELMPPTQEENFDRIRNLHQHHPPHRRKFMKPVMNEIVDDVAVHRAYETLHEKRLEQSKMWPASQQQSDESYRFDFGDDEPMPVWL